MTTRTNNKNVGFRGYSWSTKASPQGTGITFSNPFPEVVRTIDMPVALSVTTIKTGNYTAAIGQMVRVDPTLGGFNVTLPSAVGPSGALISIKNVSPSTNAVVVKAAAGQNIDGSSTYTMNLGYESITLMSTGTVWMVV